MLKNIQKALLASAAVLTIGLTAQAFAAETTTTTVIHSNPAVVVKPPVSTTVEKTVTTKSVPAGKAVTTTSTVSTDAVTTSSTAWQTKEKVLLPDSVRVVQLTEFDVNNDKILSRNEVGEKMFKMYDTDGNEVIDNIEFDRKAVITVHPVEKETIVTYDFDGDGLADQTQITTQQFMRDTLLARFDENRNGLSAKEFTGRHFMEADINNDKSVELKEFKASYNSEIDKSLKMKAETNK